MATASKPREQQRFGFSVTKDINLLKTVLMFHPAELLKRGVPEKWAEVAKELTDKFDYSLSGRTARGRVYLLLKKFEEDKEFTTRFTGTGTLEEKKERLNLLKTINRLVETGATDSLDENVTELIFNDGEIVNVISNACPQNPGPNASNAQAHVEIDTPRVTFPIVMNEPTTSELSAEISALHKRINQLEKTLKLLDDKMKGKVDLILDYLGTSRKEQLLAQETARKKEEESFEKLKNKCKGRKADSPSSGAGHVIPVFLAVLKNPGDPVNLTSNFTRDIDPLSITTLGISGRNTTPTPELGSTFNAVGISNQATNQCSESQDFDLDDVKLEPFENDEALHFENNDNTGYGSIEITVGSSSTSSAHTVRPSPSLPGTSRTHKNLTRKILTNLARPRILQNRRRQFVQSSLTSTPPSRFYYCPICSKKYVVFQNLRFHMRDHSGQAHPPFTCQSCHKKFRDPLSMAKHVRFKNCGVYAQERRPC